MINRCNKLLFFDEGLKKRGLKRRGRGGKSKEVLEINGNNGVE